ncbi:thymidine phosphorylase [bacterium DOLZORAL124_64_63]|nr:MAG: thymidine phosphorylase [bacterium DOLZORAL124_64_63]
MNILEIIEAKKRGRELTEEQIRFAVDGFTADTFAAYQMSAFLMATWFNGMTDAETAALTGAMLESGEQLDTSFMDAPSADKHSTGGVGDKVSLLLAPLAAECGLKVPMLSGRGLGHTGGTLDKLEAIPGYRIHMETDRFLALTDRVGCAIIGQSGSIAPADGRIYALRDVTATVDCIPLITASIMSKKLAAGPRTIVIDLKTGSGAFMRDLDKARELARLLVATGRRYGRRMSVVFSDMDQPLGVAVGHANETIEALDALRPGRRTTAPQDLVTLTEDLVAEMVRVSGLCPDRRQSLQRVREVWDSGRALRRALDWVAAQDGRLDPDRADFGLEVAPLAVELQAPRDGWLAGVDCRQVGLALADMGGARRRVEDPLDLSCGIDWLPQVGDAVAQGQPLARVYCARKDQARVAVKRLEAALRLSETEVPAHELIMGRVE